MTEKAKLYELPTHTVQDIPRVLRAIADDIEADAYGKVHMAAVVLETEVGNVHTFGAGGADYYRAMAMFQLGIENLVAKRGREYMK
jgi:hypothetical protein